MTEKVPTVTVERLTEYPALRMTWSKNINEADMRSAFDQLYIALEYSSKPLYIHVELVDSPMFVITKTVMAALRVFRHPRLEAWLVSGANDGARNIGGALSAITGRRNIFWFDTPEAVTEYLKNHPNP